MSNDAQFEDYEAQMKAQRAKAMGLITDAAFELLGAQLLTGVIRDVLGTLTKKDEAEIHAVVVQQVIANLGGRESWPRWALEEALKAVLRDAAGVPSGDLREVIKAAATKRLEAVDQWRDNDIWRPLTDVITAEVKAASEKVRADVRALATSLLAGIDWEARVREEVAEVVERQVREETRAALVRAQNRGGQ